jgi:hypothetical protein
MWADTSIGSFLSAALPLPGIVAFGRHPLIGGRSNRAGVP